MNSSKAIEWLFFHLWKKNPMTLKHCPGINIPDTILYRWSQPKYWYRTSQDGEIQRFTKEKITAQKIEENFDLENHDNPNPSN